MPSRQINDFSQKGNRKKLSLLPDLLHPLGDVDQRVDGPNVRGAGVAVQQEPDSRQLVLGVDADHEVALVPVIKF